LLHHVIEHYGELKLLIEEGLIAENIHEEQVHKGFGEVHIGAYCKVGLLLAGLKELELVIEVPHASRVLVCGVCGEENVGLHLAHRTVCFVCVHLEERFPAFVMDTMKTAVEVRVASLKLEDIVHEGSLTVPAYVVEVCLAFTNDATFLLLVLLFLHFASSFL
jgi:hypothetical protein